jgi:hypothetical protein
MGRSVPMNGRVAVEAAGPYARTRLVVAGVALLLIFLAGRAGWRALERSLETVEPAIAGVDLTRVFSDPTPVALTITAAWEHIPIVATREAVRTEATLWLRMHVGDWDGVPAALREEALAAMLARFTPVLADPARWDRMTAHDWDRVPQPMRALAYRHMVEYWCGYYGLGTPYGLAPRQVADTLAAIVMTESWFEHRAVNTNPWGNRDLGVAQASDGAREKLRAMFEAGMVDVRLDDEAYFNPWNGTRFVALWMRDLLARTDGDLDMAVRAYHRGIVRALAGEGEDYLEMVRRRRRAYIRNQSGSAAWSYLWRRDRALIGEAWPWLRRHQPLLPSRPLASISVRVPA